MFGGFFEPGGHLLVAEDGLEGGVGIGLVEDVPFDELAAGGGVVFGDVIEDAGAEGGGVGGEALEVGGEVLPVGPDEVVAADFGDAIGTEPVERALGPIAGLLPLGPLEVIFEDDFLECKEVE